jgi:uncharacterized Fe-S center protein
MRDAVEKDGRKMVQEEMDSFKPEIRKVIKEVTLEKALTEIKEEMANSSKEKLANVEENIGKRSTFRKVHPANIFAVVSDGKENIILS